MAGDEAEAGPPSAGDGPPSRAERSADVAEVAGAGAALQRGRWRPSVRGLVAIAVVAAVVVSCILALTFTRRSGRRPAAPASPSRSPNGNYVLPWGPADCFTKPAFLVSDVHVERDLVYGSAFNPYTEANETLLMDVYLPPAAQGSLRPAVVLIHGGAFVAGSKVSDGVPSWALALAIRGYVVASIDYRLVSKAEFFALRSPTPIVTMAQADAMKAVAFLRSRGSKWHIDGSRIAVGGDSAGAITALYYGFMPNATSAERHEAFGRVAGEATADFGVSAVLAVSGEMRGEAFCSYLGNDLQPHVCAVSSPPAADYTGELQAGDVPVLLVHGTADHVVPYVNGLAVAERANATGVRNLFITIPGGGHVPLREMLDEGSVYLGQWLSFLSGALNLAVLECPRRSALADSTLVV